MRRGIVLSALICITLGAAASAPPVGAQGRGIALPPQFEMKEKAAEEAMFDGKWMEALRQTCDALVLLEQPKNRHTNWSFSKARFLMWKALILSELGIKERALANYETAMRVLVNQGNVGSNDPVWKARVEFIASDVHRPEFIGDEEGDPQRWRQALDRCGQELEAVKKRQPPPDTLQLELVAVLEGRQRIELARVCMFLARQIFQERGNAGERDALLQDAANFLAEAAECFAFHPDWALVCDPVEPLKFKDVDNLVQQGQLNRQQGVAQKGQILAALAEWTNWRMSQAELQAQKEQEDPVLGWGFDKASVEFDKLLNFLAIQFGGDDHPIIYKTRLTRAKWYLGMARRDARVEGLLNPPPGQLPPEAQEKRDQCYRRVMTCLHDALTEVYELQNLEMATQLMKKGCVALEKDVLEELLDVENNAKGVVDLLDEEKRGDKARDRDRDRIREIKKLIDIRQFAADANEKVNDIGCPLRIPGAVAELVVATAGKDAGGQNALSIAWKPPKSSDGGTAKSYDIEISDDGGVTWKDGGNVKALKAMIPGLADGEYVVRVAGRNGAGRGAWTAREPK